MKTNFKTALEEMAKEESQLKTAIKIALQAQLKDDIKYFQELRRKQIAKDYCRGRIDEARYILRQLNLL